MIPILDTKKLANNHMFPTLFGFYTRNKLASQLLNYVYGIVMVVATVFAFHALSLILPDWNKLFIFIASLSVVGLPYCIKIVLFGNEHFEPKHAILCLAISILPAIFDFVGFYSETSIRQALIATKFELVEKVNYFNTIARGKIEEEKIALQKVKDKQIADVTAKFNGRVNGLDSSLLDAKQTAIDEREGVRGSTTSGKPGDGPRAKEIDAEVRKIKAKNDLEAKMLSDEKEVQIQKIESSYQVQINKSKEGLQEIESLVASDAKNKGILYQINNVDNFNDLTGVTIQVNNSISTISSKMNIEPQFVSFKTEDVIQLSFGALMRGEITALICCLLAFLLEMIDIVIVYMIRGAKRVEPVIEEEEKKTKIFSKIYSASTEKDIAAAKSIASERAESKIATPGYHYLDHPHHNS
jgi:hypothetical protein